MIGYRTYIAAGLIAAFGALAAVDWIQVMANPKDAWWVVGSAVVTAVMRKLTSTPSPL